MNTTTLPLVSNTLSMGSIDAYFVRINAYPFLTQEEELAYAERWEQQGDLAAAQQLVLSHLRYVARIARHYIGYGLPLADLIQEGTVGLMKAVKRFQVSRGVRLVSFAVHWIKAEIHEYILKNWRIVKIATTKAQRKLFFNLRGAKKRLGWATTEEISAIATDLNVSVKEVLRMEERLNAHDVAFDMSAEDSDNHQAALPAPALYLENEAEDNPAVLLENTVWETYAHEHLQKALDKLDPRSRQILEQRWLSETKSTLQDLATVYQVSTERIRQLEENALKKLKTALVNI
jgi:RNA polymerase sigma-32 factor